MARKLKSEPKEIPVTRPQMPDVDIHRVLSIIPIFPYHVVADIRCGTGDLTISLGKIVYDGKVLALDGQEMLDAVRKGLERLHLTNVELVPYKGDDFPLESDSLDGAIAAFVIHQVSSPKSLLAEAYRCLHRGGWLALLEWHKQETVEGPPLEKRIDQVSLGAIAQEVGFRFTARHHLNDKQYMLLMRK